MNGYRCFRQMSLFDLKSYDEIREMIKTQFKIDSDSDLGLLYLSLYQYRSLLHNTNNIGITGLSIGDINDVSSVSSKFVNLHILDMKKIQITIQS